MRNITLSFFFLWTQISLAQTTDTSWIFGVTIDDPWTNTSDIVDAFANHCQKPTARIVFDENVAATEYTEAVNQLAPKCFIMGEILDSYYVPTYSISEYLSRTTEYLDEFENTVDIWEVGNEVNGDWLGSPSDVVQKIEGAFNLVKARSKKTELTLYYNRDCYYDHPENEMFTWINTHIPESMKLGLDYVLVSYYEDDCEDVVLSELEWQNIFDSLHIIFPNSKLGIGECGTTITANKETYIDRYYQMNITTPNYIGGFFWWYYKDDCVPKTNNLWTIINDISCDRMVSIQSPDSLPKNQLITYPNPSSDIIYLNANNQPILSTQVYNKLGQLFQSTNTKHNQLNISTLPKGIYTIFSQTVTNTYQNQLVVF